MSKWSEIESAERSTILEKVADVYEKHGHPAWLKQMVVSTQKVNILMAGQQQETESVKIEGACVPQDKELADQIKSELTEVLGAVENKEIDIKVCYGVGAPFPEIENANNVMTEGQSTIKHEKGQVLLVDFWATWCPPCQAPMAHNQKMLEEHGDKWGGKVRILGLSIDSDADTCKKHVLAKGWTKVEHYHTKHAGCTASADFGVSGVPHVLIVDTNGIIVFKGHPAGRPSLEKDFETLLAGGKLEGVEGAAEEGADGSASTGPSDEEAMNAMNKFWTQSKELMNDHKDKFSDFPRAFLVLVDDAKFDARNNKLNHSMTCHTQIMGGSQEKQDDAKLLLEAINQGPWKNENMFRL